MPTTREPPTREVADRWWLRLDRSDKLNVLGEHWSGGDPLIQPNHWWRSLSDERAVQIFQTENET